MTSSFDIPDIPLIDFRPFLLGSPSERENVASSVDAGLCSTGFIYLQNHGIDQRKIDECFDMVSRSFDRQLLSFSSIECFQTSANMQQCSEHTLLRASRGWEEAHSSFSNQVTTPWILRIRKWNGARTRVHEGGLHLWKFERWCTLQHLAIRKSITRIPWSDGRTLQGDPLPKTDANLIGRTIERR